MLEEKLNELKMQTTLSTLWLAALFNLIFRDIHEFIRPGFIEAVTAKTAAGEGWTQIEFLGFAVLLNVPIMMMLLSRVLPQRPNRRANLVGAPLATILFSIGTLVDFIDLDNLFHVGIAITLFAIIFRLAWRWEVPTRQVPVPTTSAVTSAGFHP